MRQLLSHRHSRRHQRQSRVGEAHGDTTPSAGRETRADPGLQSSHSDVRTTMGGYDDRLDEGVLGRDGDRLVEGVLGPITWSMLLWSRMQ